MIRLPVPDPKIQALVTAIERAFRDAENAPIVNASFATLPGNYLDDAAAAAGGVPIGGIYRNGSVLMVRTI